MKWKTKNPPSIHYGGQAKNERRKKLNERRKKTLPLHFEPKTEK
jgi:hypothetical protein